VACMGENTGVSCGNLKEDANLEDIGVNEMGLEIVDCINLVEHRVKWRRLANTVMVLRVV
jgi:hypothetical protein